VAWAEHGMWADNTNTQMFFNTLTANLIFICLGWKIPAARHQQVYCHASCQLKYHTM